MADHTFLSPPLQSSDEKLPLVESYQAAKRRPVILSMLGTQSPSSLPPAAAAAADWRDTLRARCEERDARERAFDGIIEQCQSHVHF